MPAKGNVHMQSTCISDDVQALARSSSVQAIYLCSNIYRKNFQRTPQKQDFIKKTWRDHDVKPSTPFAFFQLYYSFQNKNHFFPLLQVHYSALRKVILTLIPDLLRTRPYRRICTFNSLTSVLFSSWKLYSHTSKKYIFLQFAFCIWKLIPLVPTHILHTLFLVFWPGCLRRSQPFPTNWTTRLPLSFQRARQMLAAPFSPPSASPN